MKTSLIYKATLAALLGLGMLSACDSESGSDGSADTENPDPSDTDVDPSDTDPNPDPSDTDVDPSDTDASDTDASDTDVDPSDTDASDTDVDTTVGPADCSCYDPAANDGLDFEDSCMPIEEALPGCAIDPSPCDPIVLEEGGEDQISDAAPVECVVQALAAGELPNFDVRFESPLGGDTTNYVAVSNGSYAVRNCGLYDNPPEYQSLEFHDQAGVDHFTACLAAHEEAPNADDLYDCMREGLPEYAGDGAFPACE